MSNSHRSGSNSTPIPWLSALLLLACIGFSVHARLRSEEVTRAGTTAFDAARDYWLAHPYLKPGTALATHLDPEAVTRERAMYEERTPIPTPPGVIRRQQGELERQVETAIANVGALPARAVAFVPGESPAYTWLSYVLLHPNNAALIGNGLLFLFFGLYLQRSLGVAAYGG